MLCWSLIWLTLLAAVSGPAFILSMASMPHFQGFCRVLCFVFIGMYLLSLFVGIKQLSQESQK
jgi:hypothetical protein